MKEVNPQSTRFNYSTVPLDQLTGKKLEEETREVRRWWLRMHGDNFRFIEEKAALQFA